MRLLVLPFSQNPPEENMRTDVELTLRAQREGTFILRWYGWKGLSLSFGYSQKKLFESFKTPLPKVLRPTGGGILLHGWDISFCLCTPSGFFKSPLELYGFITKTFLETFRELGLEVTYSRSKRGNYFHGKFCWLFPTFGEVTLGGKKLVSAAVREFSKGNFLIHGSIFVAKNPKILEKLLPTYGEEFDNRIITLSEVGLKWKKLLRKFEHLLERNLKQRSIT